MLFSYIAYAGGYQVKLQGQQQTTMGLIGTPMVFGSSGIFYNPGTISFMDSEYDFSAGVSLVMSTATFQKDLTDYQAETESPISPPFYLYGAYKINDKLAVGIGVNTPFGSSTEWDENWEGKHLIQNISFHAVWIQPTVSYKIMDNLSLGLGVVLSLGTVELQKALPYDPEAQVSLEGSTNAWGFNAGLYWEPTEKISVGVTYRSKISMNVENGDATFTIPASLQTTISPSNKFNAGLPLPANLDFGVAFKVDDKLTIAAEGNICFWKTYETLTFTFAENGELLNNTNPRKYKNTLIGRLGAQYIFNEKWTFRAGIYYDPSPTNDDYFNPETVTLNTFAFTFGATYKYNDKLEITLSYLQTNGAETHKSYVPANFSGTYKSIANIPGIGIRYRF